MNREQKLFITGFNNGSHSMKTKKHTNAQIMGLCALLTLMVAAPTYTRAADAESAKYPLTLNGIELQPTAEDYPKDEVETTLSLEPKSNWRFELNTWAWLMGLNGDVGVGDRISHVDATFLDILEDSDSLFAISGRIEVGYGKIAGFVDAIYSDISADNQSGPLGAASIDVSMKQTIVDFGLMYRIAEWDATEWAPGNYRALTIDLYGGARYTGLDVKIDPANRESRKRTEDWLDPIIGAKLVVPIEENWCFSVNGDIGGFGVNSDLTWSATGIFGYNFTVLGMPATVFAGYRAIGWDYSTGSGDDEFIFDAIAHGPLLGFSLRF